MSTAASSLNWCLKRPGTITTDPMPSDVADGHSTRRYDAVVVGSGPNGLAAAVTLARAGRSVLVMEAAETIGGGCRTQPLTLPGYLHDVCSAVHPLAPPSPIFKALPLEAFGLRWIQPPVPLAHPLLDGSAAVLRHSLRETAEGFGTDGAAYLRLMQPLVDAGDAIIEQILSPLSLPRHPLSLARFGWRGLQSAQRLATRWFTQQRVRGLFAGLAAHATLPLDHKLTAAVGLMFAIAAHRDGWPMPAGGAEQIVLALQRYLESLGGEVVTGVPVRSLADVPPARAILLDVSPRNLCRIAGDALPAAYQRKLQRFRHGPGVFKLDWALDAPIPWTAPLCKLAGTVHVGGTFDDVAAAEQAPWDGQVAEHPFLLVAQQSLFDSRRAPAGKHTGWAYCHVPHGCEVDMTERIEAQLERFAPGFRQSILQRHVTSPADLQQYNQNYIGGDISGGVMDAWQLVARPVVGLNPYATPNRRLLLCSASTPPGPGVHGMCGFHAATAALRTLLRK